MLTTFKCYYDTIYSILDEGKPWGLQFMCSFGSPIMRLLWSFSYAVSFSSVYRKIDWQDTICQKKATSRSPAFTRCMQHGNKEKSSGPILHVQKDSQTEPQLNPGSDCTEFISNLDQWPLGLKGTTVYVFTLIRYVQQHLKVVTNEKGEAVGEVLTIIQYVSGGGGAGCFFVILMGCHLVWTVIYCSASKAKYNSICSK